MKIRDLVTIQGEYTTAVDINIAFTDEKRSAKLIERFVPNDNSIKALLSIAHGLDTNTKSERAHIITGPYGVGKSLLGLIIANYFARPQISQISDLLSRMQQDWPDQVRELQALREVMKKPLLPVLIEGRIADSVNEALLENLGVALKRNNLSDLVPQIAFDIAIVRIEEWKEKYSDIYKRFESEMTSRQLQMSAFKEQLRHYKTDALRTFEIVHKNVCGAEFEPFRAEVEPRHFYSEVVKELRKRDTGFCGIIVIWDEYGETLRKIGRGADNRGDYLQEQSFSQYCKEKYDDQVIYVSIAHLTQRAYFDNEIDYQNYKKSAGRLKECPLTSQGSDEVIDSAILQLFDTAKIGWSEIRSKGNWQDLRLVIDSLELYSDKDDTWIKKRVLEGCFPLHPLTLYCLPRLSAEVGQVNRTSLAFLNQSDGGLRGFIEDESNDAFTKSGRLNLYTVDRIFDYFENSIHDSANNQKVYRGYHAARQYVNQSNDLESRIIKTIAILEILHDPKLRKTKEVISACLYLTSTDQQKLNISLEKLVKNGAIRGLVNGEYRLARGGGFDYLEEFRSVRKEIQSSMLNPMDTLNDKCRLASYYASNYNSEYYMDRELNCVIVAASALANLKQFEEVLKTPPYYDGRILYVLCQNNDEISNAQDMARRIANKQIIIAISAEPSDLIERCVDVMAATAVCTPSGNEDQPIDSDDRELMREQRDIYSNLFNVSQHNSIEPSNLIWFWRGNKQKVQNSDDLQELIYIIMKDVFPYTPKITQDRIAYKWRSSQKKDRIAALTKVLDPHSTIQLRRSANRRDAVESILRASYLETGLFQFVKPSGGDYDDYEVITPKKNVPADEAFKAIDKAFKEFEMDDVFSATVDILSLSPFGMSSSAIEMFLAAYIRLKWSNLIIMKGNVIDTLDGDIVTDIVKHPNAYQVSYRELTGNEYAMLEQLQLTLTGNKAPICGVSLNDIANRLQEWKDKLPPQNKSISEQAKILLSVVDSIINGETEIEVGLLEELPASLGLPIEEAEGVQMSFLSTFAEKFDAVKLELEGKSLGSIDKHIIIMNRMRDILNEFAYVPKPEIAEILKELLSTYTDD